MSLFEPKIPILFYSRSKLKLGLVRLGSTNDLKIIYDGEFQPKKLFKLLVEHSQILGNYNWHILISDELCYVFNLDFPKKSLVKRSEIFKHVQTEIPEDLADSDWDYKIVKAKTSSSTRALVFSPVQEYWLKLKEALIEAQIEVVAVEPEELARSRDKNPLIGLCLKNDLFGNDASVLNIRLENKPMILSLFDRFRSYQSRLLVLSLGIATSVFTLASGIIELQINR